VELVLTNSQLLGTQIQFAPGAGHNTGITPAELGFEHSPNTTMNAMQSLKGKKKIKWTHPHQVS
jgi:hypothetical protein